MEKSEPSLVPEWLKSGGSLTSSGNSSHLTSTSSSHSDNSSALRHRNKLSVGSNHDIGRTTVLDRTPAYFRRSSSSNGFVHSRSYSNFAKGQRERDWEKDNNGYHDRGKAVLTDHRNRNYSDSLDSLQPNMFDKDVLWRSQSMITGKRSDQWPRKLTNDSRASNKSNHSSSGNGLLSVVSPADGNKSSFERDFPVLGAEERQVGSEIGRVSSPGLGTTVQSLPVGISAVTASDGWTSALADLPAGVGSSGTGVAVASQNVLAGSASLSPTTMTGLNMAETLAQGPSRARTPPLLNVGTQRLEELAIKQSRQLIPLVTTSTPKTLVVSPSEKSKPKAGQQQHPSLSLNYTRVATSRSDSLKVSTENRLRVLKPSRESNGVSLTTKDNLSPTNGSSKLVNSPLNVTPSTATSAPFRSSGNSPRLATADRNQTPLWITVEKRPTAQAQSRNDFFNHLKKKSTTNSASSIPDSGPAVSPSVSEKSDELGTEGSSSSVTLKNGGVPSSEMPIADLPTENRSEITHNVDANAGSQTSDGGRQCSPDAIPYPDEEEAAFLHSLGWEENAGDDGLTEEEISTFFGKYMKLKPVAELFHRLQSRGNASSGSSSMDGEASTHQKF